uniref:Uncharacterized protein n=1 Tax=Cacopsylla melanoneura TaxID=428564 RepID=A0A8D9EYE4_9HEMI
MEWDRPILNNIMVPPLSTCLSIIWEPRTCSTLLKWHPIAWGPCTVECSLAPLPLTITKVNNPHPCNRPHNTPCPRIKCCPPLNQARGTLSPICNPNTIACHPRGALYQRPEAIKCLRMVNIICPTTWVLLPARATPCQTSYPSIYPPVNQVWVV